MNLASRLAGLSSQKLFWLSFLLVIMMLVVGCGGGGPAPVSVALSPATSPSLQAGATVSITATVSNDSLSKGVTWTLNGAGTLSGQTATSVTYTAPSPVASASTVTITATSVTDTTKTAALTINLQPVSIALTPSAAQTLEQSQSVSVSAAVSNDPGTSGVTWSLTGAGSLSGNTMAVVKYTAPASITSASSATVTATSVFDSTKTTALTINLVLPPSITTSSLASGTVGVSYSTSLAAANGVAPYSWSVSSGALPGGLVLNASSGAITGTPTAYGTFNFTAHVTDAKGVTATANLSIKINPAPLSITTTSLPNGIVNTAYSATLASIGGATPITWSITAGSLPTGLALAANGAITGTPTTAGTSSFSVQATDSSTPALTATKALSITVVPVLSITTSALSNGITSTAYSTSLAATGGVSPYTWSVTIGSLPAGLSLNSSTGAITGMPTTAGTSNFTVQAVDSGTPQQTATKALSITIAQQLVITTSSLPAGAVTSTYAATLQSSGGTPAITWSITTGTLPAGLTLNAATGAISGTPTTAGTSNFTVQATDSGTPQQNPTKALSITVNPVLAITTTSLPSGSTGAAYSQTLQTNGGGIAPISWSITLGALPGGLNLNSSTGVISGTPTAAGTFNFTVQAADSGTPQQTASKALSISVAAGPLAITPATLPTGAVNETYATTTLAATGGIQPYTWALSSAPSTFPAGLTLTSSGQITGTPAAAGTFNFIVKVTDSGTPTAQTATANFSITVNAALAVTTTTLPNGTVGSAYAATNLNATGGFTPYNWTVTAGALPNGLSLSSGGQITGQPTASGTFNFTVQVADSGTGNSSANLSIVVNPAPPLTVTTSSSSLPQGTVSTAYPNSNLTATGGIQPYTWAVTTPATFPPGLTLSTGGQITGTPTTTGTFNFTVKVTDSATPTPNSTTANLSIAVLAACGTGSESLLNGQYAFVLKGFDNAATPNPVAIGGVITANGSGSITLGDVDLNLSSGVQLNLAASGSYTIGSDHRGCMTLTTTAGTQHYRFSVGNISSGVSSTGHLIGFDAGGPFTTGVLRRQTTTAFVNTQVTGNYAFGVAAPQNTSSGGGKFAAAGVFNFSSGTVAGGVVDFNNNGKLDGSAVVSSTWPGTPVSITSGSYNISASNGRATLSFVAGGNTVNAIMYVVSSTEVLLLSSDSQTTNSLFAGQALQQSGGPFSSSSLSGNYVGYTSRAGSTAGTSRVSLLLFTPSGSTFSVAIQQNDGGTTTSNSGSGTLAVASNGRVILTIPGTSDQPLFYLANGNKAFMVNSNSGVESGFFESQSAGPFTAASASGSYAFGIVNPEVSGVKDNSGVATFDGVSALSVASDNANNTSLNPNQTFSGNYSIDSTGLGRIPSGCTIGTNCQTIFYIVSPTRALVADVGSTNTTPGVTVADK